MKVRGARSSWTGLPALLLLQAPAEDPASHAAQFVQVQEEDVRLEVLSFGGNGQPIVLLAGLGNTAHVFDELGPELASLGAVYAITRRGFGASSRPSSGYDVGRLGEDVLEVIDALRLDRPVLIGHSIAGQELSYLASEHTDRIAGIVFLDAAYRYAYDVPGEFERDFPNLPPAPPTPPAPARQNFRLPQGEHLQARRVPVDWRVGGGAEAAARAIQAGGRQFTSIPVPVVAIFASPHDIGLNEPDPAWDRFDEAMTERQVRALERGVPGARVLRWPRVSHFFFLTHEADVVREVSTFVSTLR